MEGDEQFPESSLDGRWLSYTELGQVRGIGRASAVKLAQRERWQRRLGNDRTARVLVPLAWLKPARRQVEEYPEYLREGFQELSRLSSALEATIAASRERAEADAGIIRALMTRAEKAEARADTLQSTIEAARAEIDQAEARADALQAERGQARVEAAAAQKLVAEVEAEAETKLTQARAEVTAQAEAEAARRSRGLLARVLAAVRRE